MPDAAADELGYASNATRLRCIVRLTMGDRFMHWKPDGRVGRALEMAVAIAALVT